MQYWIAVLDKITAWAIHCWYTVNDACEHFNWKKLWRGYVFQCQYTVLVYSTGVQYRKQVDITLGIALFSNAVIPNTIVNIQVW